MNEEQRAPSGSARKLYGACSPGLGAAPLPAAAVAIVRPRRSAAALHQRPTHSRATGYRFRRALCARPRQLQAQRATHGLHRGAQRAAAGRRRRALHPNVPSKGVVTRQRNSAATRQAASRGCMRCRRRKRDGAIRLATSSSSSLQRQATSASATHGHTAERRKRPVAAGRPARAPRRRAWRQRRTRGRAALSARPGGGASTRAKQSCLCHVS